MAVVAVIGGAAMVVVELINGSGGWAVVIIDTRHEEFGKLEKRRLQ